MNMKIIKQYDTHKMSEFGPTKIQFHRLSRNSENLKKLFEISKLEQY